MGGAVSTGKDNDALVDNLVDAEYIKSKDIERIFRSVDRAFYYTEGFKQAAYKDLAWKHGNLHLSAPCIYSQVMESLELEPGLSFLNLGSGTGYLCTMVGLILGSKGVNHGVEIHEDVISFAQGKLHDFIMEYPAMDEYEFCRPQFVLGNCLTLSSSNRRYQRIYCGAACPEQYETYMKHLLQVGGILVMPMNDQLLQVRRKTETLWTTNSVLSVSFASLLLPRQDSEQDLILPELRPHRLQSLCRINIRSILKRRVDAEHVDLWSQSRQHARQKKRTSGPRRCVVPIFQDSDSDTLSDNDDDNNNNDDDDDDDDGGAGAAGVGDLLLQSPQQQQQQQQQDDHHGTYSDNSLHFEADDSGGPAMESGTDRRSVKMRRTDDEDDRHHSDGAKREKCDDDDDDAAEDAGAAGACSNCNTANMQSPFRYQWPSMDAVNNACGCDDRPLSRSSESGNEAAGGHQEQGRSSGRRIGSDRMESRSSNLSGIHLVTHTLAGDRQRAALVLFETNLSPHDLLAAHESSQAPLTESETGSADEFDDTDVKPEQNYTHCMKKQLLQLPLPHRLRSYLNFDRPF